jgi:Protein of unknown function (DUF2878)
MTIASNIILFQFGWFACVLSAARGVPWIGVLTAVAIVAWHLARARRPPRELGLIATAAAFGALFETFLVRSGWVRFDSGVLHAHWAPIFMVVLWANFATTLNVSLRWMRGRTWLATLVGAVGGPVAYYSGARLGAMDLIAPGQALGSIAAGWGVMTPLLLKMARRLDGYACP